MTDTQTQHHEAANFERAYQSGDGEVHLLCTSKSGSLILLNVPQSHLGSLIDDLKKFQVQGNRPLEESQDKSPK